MFIVIVLCLILVSIIGTALLALGLVSLESLTNPVFPIFLAFVISAIVTYAVFTIANSLILKPLNSMVEAKTELGRGNFDVRIEINQEAHIREIDQFVESFNASAAERTFQNTATLKRHSPLNTRCL